MKFDMSIEDNYSSFNDSENGLIVFVDSFDNKEFDVRIGSMLESTNAGKIKADNSDDLNEKLSKLYQQYLGEI